LVCDLQIMTLSPVAALVRQHDPDRFLACLFAPPERREAAFVACAFHHELARAREVVSHPTLALIRLQWWREVVEGARRRHEVAQPLGDMLDSGQLHAGDLLEMIAGREAEAWDSIPDVAAWRDYLLRAFGGVAVAMGRALGAGAQDVQRLRLLGAGYGATGVLLGVAGLAGQGRCLLPQDVLAAHGLTPEDVIHDPRQAQPAIADLAGIAGELLASPQRQSASGAAGRGTGAFDRAIVAASLPAVLARRDLQRQARVRGFGDKFALIWAGVTCRV